MRKFLIILAVLLVGIGAWAYFGGFERMTAGRIETALVERGVPEPVAACMGERLAEKLTLGQLRELQELGERESATGMPTNMVEFLERLRNAQDRELIAIVGSSAALCSFAAV